MRENIIASFLSLIIVGGIYLSWFIIPPVKSFDYVLNAILIIVGIPLLLMTWSWRRILFHPGKKANKDKPQVESS